MKKYLGLVPFLIMSPAIFALMFIGFLAAIIFKSLEIGFQMTNISILNGVDKFNNDQEKTKTN